ASGQADLARQVSARKKPSLPLWAANQLRDQAMLGELRSGAQALVKAQAAAATGRSNAGRDLRAASERFQRSLEAAGTAAVTKLREGSHATGEETLRRIREILRLAALEGGRASCRERVEIAGGAVPLEKETERERARSRPAQLPSRATRLVAACVGARH